MTGTIAEPIESSPPVPKVLVSLGSEPIVAAEPNVVFTVSAQEVSPTGTLTPVVMSATGTGGTSTASGCKTIRITNVGHTFLHAVAYKFWTQVHWCWNRGFKTISQVSRAWDVTNVALTFRFDGIVKTSSGFYGWLGALYPHSGYFYNKTAKFTNVCPLKMCFATTFPKNKINVHSNGTWWFSKTGAG